LQDGNLANQKIKILVCFRTPLTAVLIYIVQFGIFMAISQILQPFGIFVSIFVQVFPHLVCSTIKHLATLL
jgi:hypothetical protein